MKNDSEQDFVNTWQSAFAYGALMDKLGCKPTSDIRKVEVTKGKTYFQFNGIDSEIVAGLPDSITKDVPENRSIYTYWIEPGHFKVWCRLDQLHSDLGRWIYMESKIPPHLLRYPNSKSYLNFERFVSVAFSLGITLRPDTKPFLSNIAAQLLNPDALWVTPTTPR